ncbi:DUF669 domain-containing protein [Paludisphaera soli]|uniref:DUF669 domain-containing protein n=1 Tax=Paludisphaera soli TaxID=2712865 RepID=UPI0013EE0DE6|nr:DUF669 domain-containing protein [Paludisphaera soli]
MSTDNRPRLDDILTGGSGGGNFDDLWNSTEAAGELEPLPAGTYRALVTNGELATSRAKGTPSYKLTLDVIDPPSHAGRRIWHDLWLTPPALPSTKRDLAKLGIVSPAQLRQAPRSGMVVEVKLALRTGDDGATFNRVGSFKVVSDGTPAGALDLDAAELTGGPDDGEGDSRDAGGFDWRDGRQRGAARP